MQSLSFLRTTLLHLDAILQLMDNLLADSVASVHPFFTCGADFADLITTLLSKERGRKTNKSYIALFICFAMQMIHLELIHSVSDLSFEAFYSYF